MKNRILILCICLFLAGSLGFIFLHSQDDLEGGVLAPLNPEFIRWRDARRAGMFYQDPRLGYRPSPAEIIFSGPIAAPLDRTPESYDASYDLRNSSKVPPIKNQGSCGACWAFAATGSVESSLLPSESRNFSEQHLNKYHGFDNAECGGGSLHMAAAYYTRWDGPYNETDYPYPYGSPAIWPTESAPSVQKHVQKWVWLPNDKDTIKSFLTSAEYGGVTLGFYWADTYYNASNSAFYCPTALDTNHVVLIVGWDDNFSKTKFSTQPANNGAWLIKNSWGASWGSSGYFWMSYEDKTIKGVTVFSAVKPVTDYRNIYQYDPLGWVNSWGGAGTTFWGANIFTATTNDPLAAIGTYTTDECVANYFIYKHPSTTNPTSGTLVASGSAATLYASYITIELANPVTLAPGDRFSVVIRYNNDSNIYPVPIEYYVSGYSSAATNSWGQSFRSSNGSTWGDFADVSGNADKYNCCIKAFTGKYVNYTLTMQKSGNGTTTPVPGTHTYIEGTDVEIRASPDAANVFTGWTGAKTGTTNPTTVRMDDNKTVTANFRLVNPPSNLTAVRMTNRSLTQTEYIIQLDWTANAANAGLNITKYRLYQKEGDNWHLIGDVSSTSALTAWIRPVPKALQTFGVASVTDSGRESFMTTIEK